MKKAGYESLKNHTHFTYDGKIAVQQDAVETLGHVRKCNRTRNE